MKLHTPEKQFLELTNDFNMSTRRGAEYELNTSGFTSTTVRDLEKKGFITVGTSKFFAPDQTRSGVADVWVTAAGREALHNA